MSISKLPLAVRLHRYGFLLSADLVSAGRALNALLAATPANDTLTHTASRERELFRRLTCELQQARPRPKTNLRILPSSVPVSPASFAAALWGLPFTARATVLLVCVEGYSLTEAAFIVNLPLHRAEDFMLSGISALQPDLE
ncbi:hypothetical protein [Glycocaulis sp.]|uniref:hypothetical protein n=1 Tax=Glycocaulis sp. TaxID=1969725 RepID=UPI003D1C7733